MGNATDSAKQLGCVLDARAATSSLENSFYIIPSYQRGFKWREQETNRLLEEIWSYYSRYMKDVSKSSGDLHVMAKFVGTIIRVPAEEKIVSEMLEDKTGGSLQCKILIDGQQRLTVFTLLVLCMLRRAELYWNLLGKEHFQSVHSQGDTDEILGNQSNRARKFIRNSLIKEMLYALADKEEDYLTPRLVREGKDKLRGENEDSFESVTAELVYKEWKRVNSGGKKDSQKYNGITRDSVKIFSEENQYRFSNSNQFNENFKIVIDIIDEFLDQFCNPSSPVKEKPKCDFLDDISENQICTSALVVGFKKLHTENEDSLAVQNDSTSEEVMRLATLWNFLKQYVFLAIVDCDSDNELDIFESLNTAGRPLSPVETFIPEVHKYFARYAEPEAMKQTTVPYIFSNSADRKKQKSTVLDILDSLRMYGEADGASSPLPADILTSFAVIFDGTKLEANSRCQREYLKGAFAKCAKFDEENELRQKNTLDFLVYLTMTTEWWRMLNEAPSSQNFDRYKAYYKEKIFVEDLERGKSRSEKSEQECLEEQAIMALVVLYQAGFKLPISIACRFYIEYRLSSGKKRRLDAYVEFLKALRALLAFTVLWISSHETTARIESKFRDVLSGNSKLCKLSKFCGLSLYSCSDNSLRMNQSPSVGDLKFILRKQLSEDFSGKFTLNEWKKRLGTEKPAQRKTIAQFLILCSWHRTDFGGKKKPPQERGLRRPAKGRVNKANDFLNLESWVQYSNYDIEHVLPQKPSREWKSLVSLDSPNLESLIQSLGNVTLLPLSLNRSLHNVAWETKKNGLKALILRTKEATLSFFNALEPKEKRKFTQYLKSHVDDPTEECLEELTDDKLKWDEGFISRRTNRMAEIIWRNLQEFLDLPEESEKDIAETARLSSVMLKEFTDRNVPENQEGGC